ncbi:VOC family protein [Jonesia quinghaiensis]|uniref:VOC family protein n=1 Tax=Jonesia quinghaiensis TaxID=262806 RepID=UPI000401E666|nr:VOC family protein [Jonesia quinghaiensis]
MRPVGIHHVEVWVPDLERAGSEFGWVLTTLGFESYQTWQHGFSYRLGTQYVVCEQSPHLQGLDHNRMTPGLNHLALWADSRDVVDEIAVEATKHGWTLMYPDKHPYAGGRHHYAAYLENNDGFELEVVAYIPGRR